MAYSVKFTTSYEDSTQKRLYAFDVEEDKLPSVKSKIKAINSSLASGSDGGLASFFKSDDGHNLAAISDASIVAAQEYHIPLGGE